MNIQFIVGNTYTTRSMCDDECIFSMTVVKRTASTVTINFQGKVMRLKIRCFGDGHEYLRTASYSFAPLFSAERTAA